MLHSLLHISYRCPYFTASLCRFISHTDLSGLHDENITFCTTSLGLKVSPQKIRRQFKFQRCPINVLCRYRDTAREHMVTNKKYLVIFWIRQVFDEHQGHYASDESED